MLLPSYCIAVLTLLVQNPTPHALHHYDLSYGAEVPPGPGLPPAQVALVTSIPREEVLVSRGCQATELRLQCPVNRLLLSQAAQWQEVRQGRVIDENIN